MFYVSLWATVLVVMLSLILLGSLFVLLEVTLIRSCSARVIFGGDSRYHVIPLLRDHLHWLRASASCLNFAFWCTRQFTAWHHVISTNCAFHFRLFPIFLLSVPLLVVIWSYPGQGYNSVNRAFRMAGPVARNGLSPHIRFAPTLSTFRNMLRTHLFSRSYSTNCFQEYEQRTLYGAFVVTLATLLRLINCFIIIIIIIYYY